MEIAKKEVEAVQEATTKAEEVIQLDQLQLAMIGGGCGEVLFG